MIPNRLISFIDISFKVDEMLFFSIYFYKLVNNQDNNSI